MAASATLHSYMAGLMPRVGSRSRSTGLRSTYLLPCQRPMRIRCQAEDQPREQSVPVTPPPQPAHTPTPKPKAKMAFSEPVFEAPRSPRMSMSARSPYVSQVEKCHEMLLKAFSKSTLQRAAFVLVPL